MRRIRLFCSQPLHAQGNGPWAGLKRVVPAKPNVSVADCAPGAVRAEKWTGMLTRSEELFLD